MKKYLITGALALVACATLTSCHSDDELSGSLVQQKIKAYEQVFEEEFGKVDPNQDWGFGTAEILARTRTAMDRTRTENKNLNQWGDPNYGNWKVPDALTDGQKTRVMAYFQANPGLTYEDPHLTDFFIQQVYKGGTTPGAISSEQYTQTNGTPLIGSNNMDWLYMGTGLDHVNDYNNGQWNDGTPYEVLNTGANTNDHQGNTTHVEGVTHPDMITLMENSSTEFVAFGSSTGNQYHTDCCALAGWRVIEAWAIAHEDSLKAIGKFGATLDDGWNRSFVGLDYENTTIDNLYSSKGNAKAKDFMDGNSHWVLYNGTVVNANNFADFDLKDVYGNNVRYVTDNVSNQAIADYIKYTKSDNTVGNVTKDAYNYKLTKQQFKDLYNVDITNGEDGLYNLDMIMGYIRQSAHPTENNGNWVKNIGGRDYVFSDWIVTLTEAKKQNGSTDPNTIVIPIEPGSQGDDYRKDVYYKKVTFDEAGSGRVFCEDLGVVRASDIDFNDIVFDVLIYKTEYIIEHQISSDGVTWEVESRETTSTTYDGDVWLLAGGGTIPATIQAGGTNYNVKESFEYQLSDKVIVNTIENDEGRYGNPYRNFPTAKKLNNTPLAISSVADVKIFVTYGAEFAELTAFKGVAPHKICVPLNTLWLKEREEISNGYPSFNNYVKNQDADGNSLTQGPVGTGEEYESDERTNSVWTNYVEASLYTLGVTYTARHQASGWSEEEVKTDESTVTGGGTNSGYRDGDPVLIRRRH